LPRKSTKKNRPAGAQLVIVPKPLSDKAQRRGFFFLQAGKNDYYDAFYY
jgi:hypothetical protein